MPAININNSPGRNAIGITLPLRTEFNDDESLVLAFQRERQLNL